MTILPSIILAAALTIGGPAPEVKSENEGLPAWLAGTWVLEDGSAWGDEVWMAPRGGAMIGTWDAGTAKRAFGWAAGSAEAGVQSRPFQSIRWAGASSVRPSHQTSPSSVRATLV